MEVEHGAWLEPVGLGFVLAAVLVALVVGGLALRDVGEDFSLSDEQVQRIEASCERRAGGRGLTGERRAQNVESCIALERTVRTPDLPPD